MQPGTATTTEIWQWQCATSGASCKMVRQVTTSCPHGCRCCLQGTPSAGNPHHHHHHHHHHRQEGNWAVLATESNAGRNIALSPAPPVAETEFWVPDPNLMVQQLGEFESLNDEVVALRVQLEEYRDEIEKSKRDNDGRNWFLALPDNVRNILVMARDAIGSLAAVAAPPAN